MKMKEMNNCIEVEAIEVTTEQPKENFFTRHKKKIIIGATAVAVGIGGYVLYKVFKEDPKEEAENTIIADITWGSEENSEQI